MAAKLRTTSRPRTRFLAQLRFATCCLCTLLLLAATIIGYFRLAVLSGSTFWSNEDRHLLVCAALCDGELALRVQPMSRTNRQVETTLPDVLSTTGGYQWSTERYSFSVITEALWRAKPILPGLRFGRQTKWGMPETTWSFLLVTTSKPPQAIRSGNFVGTSTAVSVHGSYLVAAAAGLTWLSYRRIPHLAQPHECPKCRYDLRSTPEPAGPLLDRCPECGHETATGSGAKA